MTKPGDFFEELKRRKVFRVAVVYAATAFVILQAADIILPRLGIPEWGMSLVVILTILGFPIALTLGWALDVTPDGIKRTEALPEDQTTPTPPLIGKRTGTVAAGLLLLGIGLSAGWFLSPGTASDPVAEPVGPIESAAPSIAVLPFANLSSDPENAYFADGLTEEVLNSLARVPALKVAGRTSSFYFKDRNEDLQTIGTQLGVGHLLEGSVRKSGDQLRITVQLIEVADGFRLWSDAYDREMDDIFVIQDEIARSIVDALRIELGTDAAVTASTTEHLGAYERFLEARTLIAERGPASLNRAIALLDEAVRLDPTFAPAWGALAQAHSLVYWYDTSIPRESSVARAEAAAQQALQLDPDLTTAHQVLGDVLRDRFQWPEADASYRRALALNPDDVEGNSQYAQMLGRLGLAERGLPFARRAAELDPLSAVPPAVVGLLLFQSGDREGGLRQVQYARTLNPGLLFIHLIEMAIQLDLGAFDAALETQRIMGAWLDTHHADDPLADLYERLPDQTGDTAEIPTLLRDSWEQGSSHLSVAAQSWAVHYGDPELALELMRTEQRSDGAYDSIFSWTPYFAPVRDLAGFRELARDLNMPEYWRMHGWPSDCRPLEGNDFECGLDQAR